MNDVTLMYQNMEAPVWEERLLEFVHMVLNNLRIENWEFSITLCDDAYIHVINRDYREKDRPTDVITFAMCDEPFPMKIPEEELYSAGDIIISLDSVKENSRYFKVDNEEELKRVVIHGILHLDGMDHETNNADEEMLVKQEEILASLPEKGIYN